MANSQSSGAGDGPTSFINTNRNTDAPSSPWTKPPLSVCNVIGSKVDTKALHAMRLACTDWQKIVEQSVGLKVKVDDSKEGNLEFVKRVKVESARVLNWTVEIGAEPANHLFQHPDWLQKLKLCGKMPAKWKIHDLCQFPNLAHLVLRDKALYSNNLTGHQYPIINFDPTSELSADEMLIKAFKTQDPPSENQPIELKSLQTLEIIRYGYYANTETKLQTHSYLLIMANMCFILSHVQSPVLSVAHLSISLPHNFRGSYDKINFTLVPLHKFLDNHRTSLRQLYLPNLRGLSTDLFQHENLSNSFPNNLQKVMLSLEGVWRDLYSREPPVLTTFAYLQKCLQEQTQLQHVHFDFTSFPLKWTSDAFTSVANSCGHSLRYLEIQGYPDGGEGSLDLQILSVCHCLEVLHMPSWGRTSMTFTNLEKLPVSLKRLVICEGEDGQITIADANVFKRLTALEWIFLFGIRLPIASNSGNQEPERQFCRTMMRGLLGLRQLQGFNLEIVGVGMNGDPSLVKMLSPLDRRINPASRYQFPLVSFNLKHPRYDGTPPPWSDNLFDIHKWDLLEKYKDDVEEPRQLTVLGHILQEMDQNDAGENANGANEHDDNDEDEDMDLDEVVVSSDEDDF